MVSLSVFQGENFIKVGRGPKAGFHWPFFFIENENKKELTHMIFRLTKLIIIMYAQLGIIEKPPITYPTGSATPYLTNAPSNGWKMLS